MVKKQVLVLFKTHLDVGFTDLAETVTERYLSVYLPNAIRVGNELKDTDTPFGRRLLQYGVKDAKEDLWFCLYDNIWNTNFPMWYSDDGLFRFTVSPRTAPTAK